MSCGLTLPWDTTQRCVSLRTQGGPEKGECNGFGNVFRTALGSDDLMVGGVNVRFDLRVLCPSSRGINEGLGPNWLVDTRFADAD